jgi:DNA-binding transcriptional LysR family regulator
MRRGDLADLTAFAAVAEQLSFRAAAARLGVTASALSHTIRGLEERFGARLLNRTTRSVSLTDAGLRLLNRTRPALAEVESALDDLGRERQRPFGRLRLHVSPFAFTVVVAPVWGRYLSRYPNVELDLRISSAPVDLVTQGLDAGIGVLEWAAADMTAVRVSEPIRTCCIGSPEYFARHRPPRTPDDLSRHSCIGYRFTDDSESPVWPAWTFKRGGKRRRKTVPGRVVVNVADAALRAALDGLGIAHVADATAEPYVRSGQLIRVLERWSPRVEGFYLYHPSRRQMPAALRALIGMIRISTAPAG